MALQAYFPNTEADRIVWLGTPHEESHPGFQRYSDQGVRIESRRNGGTWEFLAIDTVKPHIDDRPLLTPGTAETRKYRMRWWDKGKASGEWSPVQGGAVGG